MPTCSCCQVVDGYLASVVTLLLLHVVVLQKFFSPRLVGAGRGQRQEPRGRELLPTCSANR